jgi:hypothetical protein
MKKFLVFFLIIISSCLVSANPQKETLDNEDVLSWLLENDDTLSEEILLEEIDLLSLESIELLSEIDLEIINEILDTK